MVKVIQFPPRKYNNNKLLNEYQTTEQIEAEFDEWLKLDQKLQTIKFLLCMAGLAGFILLILVTTALT